MLAVVEIAGQQFEVKQNDVLTVAKLSGNPGETVEFNKIFATVDGGNTTVGTPLLDGKVEAKIVEHGRGVKVLVFHKKRRKGYRKLNGFKPHYTTIEITNINL